MKVGVINQARMGSTRLPGKVMMDLEGKPLLYYSTARSALSRYADQVVVATTYLPQDDAIELWCEEEGFACFRGEPEDVLDRYYRAASKFGFELVVRVTSDDPFTDPTVIDMLVLAVMNVEGLDYASIRIKRRTWPHGLDAEAMTFEALERAWREARNPGEREHVTGYITGNPHLFKTLEIPFLQDLSWMRLTVDYPEDLERARALMARLLPSKGISFGVRDVIEAYRDLFGDGP